MMTTFTKYGNQTVLVIAQQMLDELQLDFETPLNIETEGQTLIISPVRDLERHEQFRTALAQVNQQYGRMLKRLAE